MYIVYIYISNTHFFSFFIVMSWCILLYIYELSGHYKWWVDGLCVDGDSSILNGSCVVLFCAFGGGPHDTWRCRDGRDELNVGVLDDLIVTFTCKFRIIIIISIIFDKKKILRNIKLSFGECNVMYTYKGGKSLKQLVTLMFEKKKNKKSNWCLWEWRKYIYTTHYPYKDYL